MTPDDDPGLPRRAVERPASLVVPHPSPRDFDPVMHDRMRLGIVVVLLLNERASFTELRNALGMTDGNLNVHIRRLEEAGYIAAQKLQERRVPHTEYTLTPAGRRALDAYLTQLDGLMAIARAAR